MGILFVSGSYQNYQNMDVNNQLTNGVLGVTMNLLMCDRQRGALYCTHYKTQSNDVSTYFNSSIP